MKHILSLLAMLLSAAAATATEPTSAKPNVLMICIDDLNDWVGFLGGHPQAITPKMDILLVSPAWNCSVLSKKPMRKTPRK